MTDTQSKKRMKAAVVDSNDPSTWPTTGVWEEYAKLSEDQKEILPFIVDRFLENKIPLTFPVGQSRDEGPYPEKYDPKAKDHCAFWRSCNPIALSKWVIWVRKVDEPFRKFDIQLRTQSAYDPSKMVAVVWHYCLGEINFPKPFPGSKFDTGTWDKATYVIDPHFMPGPNGWPEEMLYSPNARTMPALAALMCDISFKVAKPLLRELVWRAGRDFDGKRPCACKIPGLWKFWRNQAKKALRSPHKNSPDHDKDLIADARQTYMEGETMFYGVSKNELASDDPHKHRKFVAELRVFHHEDPKASLSGKGVNVDWGIYHTNKTDSDTLKKQQDQKILINNVRKEALDAGFKINEVTFLVPMEDDKGNLTYVKKTSNEYALKRGTLVSGGVLFAPKLVTKDDKWTVSCTLKNAGPVTVLYEPEETSNNVVMPKVEPWMAMARKKNKRMEVAPSSASTAAAAPAAAAAASPDEPAKDDSFTAATITVSNANNDADAASAGGAAVSDNNANNEESMEPETQPFPDTPPPSATMVEAKKPVDDDDDAQSEDDVSAEAST